MFVGDRRFGILLQLWWHLPSYAAGACPPVEPSSGLTGSAGFHRSPSNYVATVPNIRAHPCPARGGSAPTARSAMPRFRQLSFAGRPISRRKAPTGLELKRRAYSVRTRTKRDVERLLPQPDAQRRYQHSAPLAYAEACEKSHTSV